MNVSSTKGTSSTICLFFKILNKSFWKATNTLFSHQTLAQNDVKQQSTFTFMNQQNSLWQMHVFHNIECMNLKMLILSFIVECSMNIKSWMHLKRLKEQDLKWLCSCLQTQNRLKNWLKDMKWNRSKVTKKNDVVSQVFVGFKKKEQDRSKQPCICFQVQIFSYVI